MKFNYLIFLLSITFLAKIANSNVSASTSDKNKNAQVIPQKTKAKPVSHITPAVDTVIGAESTDKPAVKPTNLAPGQFSIYFKSQYHIFTIREYKKLKLSSNCFKKDLPKCQAYDVAQIKVKNVVTKIPGQTHPASMHCARLMGQNLIAYDHENNEYDFCRFPDDSLVSSWSIFNNAYQGPK
jgi:putative hemolysin